MAAATGTGSRARILKAASVEFARASYAAASVDRIARRARLNKAMIYYHFGSKLGLYQDLLRDAFRAVAAKFADLTSAPLGPVDKVRRVVEIYAETAAERPYLPPIMLREVAGRGQHLDTETARTLKQLPLALGSVLAEGVSTGEFRPVNPFLVHFSIVAPLMLFIASEPMRQRLATEISFPEALPTREAFVAHVQTTVLSMLHAEGVPPALARGGSRHETR